MKKGTMKLAVVLLNELLALLIATQFVAYFYGYDLALGKPLISLFGYFIYTPWSFVLWDFTLESGGGVFLGAWGIFLSISFVGLYWITKFKAEENIKRSTTHGSAEWASSSVLKRAGLLNRRGVILGIDDKGRYIRHDGPEHVKVIAPTRSGKGVGVVIPTLLSWDGSVIVYDLKSENWNCTSGYRSQFSNVLYFNPADPKSCHFNPLLEVRKGPLEVRDVQNIADMIVDPDGHGMSDHWAKTGHSLLVGTILHVLYAEKDKTLSGVANFLSNPDMNLESTLRFMMHASHLEDGNTHPIVAATARDMLNKCENERSGVLSTAMSFLSLYRDPIIGRNTSNCDFRILDLVRAKRPVSLYIAIPPSDVDRLRSLTRLIINQICRRLTEELKPQGNKHKLLMLLDEFPALGKLNFFETALGFLAGYGIKAMLISQSINQIEKAYGPRNSIMDNSHVKVMFTPNTIQTAEMISKMLGQGTLTKRQENLSRGWLSPFPSHTSASNHELGRALLTADEVMKFPKDESMIFVAGECPIKARKIKYFEDKNFTVRLKPTPILREVGPYPFKIQSENQEWTRVLSHSHKERSLNDELISEEGDLVADEQREESDDDFEVAI